MDKRLTSNIQLNWLRTFEVAAKELSFTQAAKILNMSQSAVSQQVQLLEHHIDHKLFIRANRTIQLSDAGRAFLPLVENCMRELNIGAAQIFTPLNASVVEVSINTSFSVLWMGPNLDEFHSIYPNVAVRQLGTNWDSDFNISTAELEIRYGDGKWPEFEVTPLITPHLRPYCSETVARNLRHPEDFKDVPLLEVIGTPCGWSQWLEEAGETSLVDSPRHYMDSHAAAVAMAANGFGACLMYDDMMYGGVFAQHLTAPFHTRITTTGNYYLCHRHDIQLSPASLAFKDWLLDMNSISTLPRG